MAIEVHRRALRDLGRFPDDILAQAKEAFRFLESGVMLTMPLSRPMPSIWKNAHELRIAGRDGQYRIIYVLLGGGDIFIAHCFQKKKESTPLKDLYVAKSRTKEFIHAARHREV